MTTVWPDDTDAPVGAGAPTCGRSSRSSAWAALLTLFATRHGPGLSPDSVYYLSSGISLADAGQLRQLTGHPMTVFPPGLPALIAIGVWCGVDAETAARIVCVATAAAIVVLGHLLLRQLDLGHRALWTATVLLAGSPVLLAVDRMAWSEPPFIACSLALLTILERSWRRGWFSVLDFSLAVLLCWASFAFRYSGVVSIPASALTILLMLRKRLVHAAIVASSFAVAAASLPIAWMMRNHSIDGTYLGPRDPSTDDLTDVALRIKTVLADWLFPSGPSGVRFAALLVFATLLERGVGRECGAGEAGRCVSERRTTLACSDTDLHARLRRLSGGRATSDEVRSHR